MKIKKNKRHIRVKVLYRPTGDLGASDARFLDFSEKNFGCMSVRFWRKNILIRMCSLRKLVKELEVNQKELAKILGLTDRHIRRLRDEYGLFQKKTGKRTYTLESCVPEYIDYKLEEAGKAGNAFNREKQLAEHEEIKKKISILKLRKLKRQLHEAVDVEEFLTDMLISFRSTLLSIPQKVTPMLVGEDDSNVILEILEREVFETLKTLSEYNPMKIDKEEDLFDDADDDEEE